MPSLYEAWNPVTRRSTEVVTDPESGLPLIIHTQDTAPIVASAKQLAGNFDRHRRNPHGMTHVARIPGVIVRQLMRTGVWWDERALNAWLDARDQRVFRTDDARRLS